MNKTYYKIEFELSSPLIVGCGTERITDNDVSLNSLGKPYIPGTAIAGVLRHFLSEKNKEMANKLFGEVEVDEVKRDKNASESQIITYDANIIGEYNISIRDGVALDEYKVAKDGAKMNFQVVETGAKFVTYLEDTNHNEGLVDELLSYLNSGECSFGSKTTRGYGNINVIKIGRKSFDSVKDWLDFDLSKYDSWNDYTPKSFEDSNYNTIVVTLKQKSGISIRRYSTEPPANDSEKESGPDSVHLTVKKDGEEVAVIPGTSWAGAFRNRMEESFSKKGLTDEISRLFGRAEDEKSKSLIMFSETQLKDTISKINTRTAVDSITGGNLDGSLFTEKSYYKGHGELVIRIHKGVDVDYREALAESFTDLHYGFMAIGGLTSVGRGLFEIEKMVVNGTDCIIGNKEEKNVYKTIKSELDKNINL